MLIYKNQELFLIRKAKITEINFLKIKNMNIKQIHTPIV